MNAVLALSRFESFRAIRNRRVLFMTVLYPALLYMLVSGSAKGNLDGTDIPVKTYYLIAYTSFGVIGASLNNNAMRISQERKEGWVKQLRLTAAPSYGYVTSKVLASLLIVLPAIVVTFAIGAASGAKLDASQWISAFLALWLGSLAFTALGVAIGYGVPQDSAQIVTMIVFLAGSLLGGQFFQVTGVLQNIGKAFPTYWMREISMDAALNAPIAAKGVLILAAWTIGCAALAAVLYTKRAED